MKNFVDLCDEEGFQQAVQLAKEKSAETAFIAKIAAFLFEHLRDPASSAFSGSLLSSLLAEVPPEAGLSREEAARLRKMQRTLMAMLACCELASLRDQQ